MIAPARPVVPRLDDDTLVVVVDQDAEPADVDRLLDALDRILAPRAFLLHPDPLRRLFRHF